MAQITTWALPDVATATIANGASLSGAVDCSAGRLGAIVMPASWTTANLTFSSSVDGVTYNDKKDSVGNEYTVTAAASQFITLNPQDFLHDRYIKIRSGTSGTPVNQGAARSITVSLLV